MKNTCRTILISACFFPGLILTAASSQANGPRSLKDLCFDALAYCYAKPATEGINTTTAIIGISADITSKSDRSFTVEHAPQIQSSVEKMQAEHRSIKQRFYNENDRLRIRIHKKKGYAASIRTIQGISKPDFVPRKIADNLSHLMNKINSNTLTFDDCCYLLNIERNLATIIAFSGPSDIRSLDKLQKRVENHYNKLCESNTDPDATINFTQEKNELIKTINNEISFIQRRIKIYESQRELINSINYKEQIHIKADILFDDDLKESSQRQTEEERQAERQHAERMAELQRQHAERMRQHAERMAELQRQHAERMRQHAEQMAELQRQHAERMAELQRQHAEQMAELVRWGKYLKSIAAITAGSILAGALYFFFSK